MLDAQTDSRDDHEINVWPAIELFVPFCFDAQNCVSFDDPLAVRGAKDEQRRLDLIIKFNLADIDRGFLPGAIGAPVVNTPSLRAVWTQPNLLHTGLAHSYREAILAPGHPLLQPGENGFAIDALGKTGVHGATENISADDLKALIRFIESIE